MITGTFSFPGAGKTAPGTIQLENKKKLTASQIKEVIRRIHHEEGACHPSLCKNCPLFFQCSNEDYLLMTILENAEQEGGKTI